MNKVICIDSRISTIADALVSSNHGHISKTPGIFSFIQTRYLHTHNKSNIFIVSKRRFDLEYFKEITYVNAFAVFLASLQLFSIDGIVCMSIDYKSAVSTSITKRPVV